MGRVFWGGGVGWPGEGGWDLLVFTGWDRLVQGMGEDSGRAEQRQRGTFWGRGSAEWEADQVQEGSGLAAQHVPNPNPHFWALQPYMAAWICTSKMADVDLKYPLGQVGV